MEELNVCSIPAIAALCYGFIEMLKKITQGGENEKLTNAYPMISAILGALLGIAAFLIEPSLVVTDSLFGAALAGMASGLTATGSNQVLKQMQKIKETENISPRYYITGDKHRRFKSLIKFCKKNKLTSRDVVIILGDAGFNYYGDERDDALKAKLSKINVTLFCLHGNRENRPQNITTYGIRNFCGGKVYYEPKYPQLLFAIDGEIYNFNGKEFICIGGAHSVDRQRCIAEGLPYWQDEEPSDDVKLKVETELARKNHEIYGFLTHTCPISVLPTEMFLSTRSFPDGQATYELEIDHSTEKWLETLKQKVNYVQWYCGHYHIDKEIGDIVMLGREIKPFCETKEEICTG